MFNIRKWLPVETWIKRYVRVISVESAYNAGAQEQVCHWCRIHGVDPDRTQTITVYPVIKVAVFNYINYRNGRPFAVLDSRGELNVSYSWWPKRLIVPPKDEWCE